MRKNKKGIALAIGLALLLGAIGLALEFQGGFSVAGDNHQLADVSGIIASESSSVSIPTALSASTSPAMPFSAGVTGATSTVTSSASQTPRNAPSSGAGPASAKVTDAKKLTAKTPVTKISRVPAATAVLPMPLLIITPGPIFEPDGTAAETAIATTTTISTTTVATPTASTITTTTVTAPASLISKTLPYSIGTFGNTFDDNDGWSVWQGAISRSNSLLTVRSDAVIGGTSGGALLDGSSAWTDYVFSAKLDWNKGISFGLIGHYVDDKNYVVCNFTQPAVGSVHLSIHELVNGQDNDLADGQISNYNQLGGAGINTALSLQGTQAVCALNGYSISTVFASTKLTGPLSGEVGFTTWDRAPGGSEINVHSVGVTAQAYSLGNNNVQDPNK